MSNEEDLLLAAAAYIIISDNKKTKKRKRKCWVRPSLQQRTECGGIQLINALQRDDSLTDGHLQNFLRISSLDIEYLLRNIGPIICKADTNCRKAISPLERLLVTLRFLATGDSYHSLMYLFRISKQVISKIIPEVCEAIVNTLLEDHLKMPTKEEDWKAVTAEFNRLWNFPKCVGVMDGKHIQIQAPANSGSEFFNYKGFFSVVLFAVANSNYQIMYFNIGCQGRISDGGVFSNTRFKKMLMDCKLYLPADDPLPGRSKPVPYVFLGDDAFPLSRNLLKPYPGAQLKGSAKRVFNYRLSRARRVSENVFGILSARFRVLRKPLLLSPEKVEKIVSACIYLHNFLRNSSSSKRNYTPPGTFDSEDKDTGDLILGSWRREANENSNFVQFQEKAYNSSTEAQNIRQEYTEFFMTSEGQVSWQDNNI